MIPENGRFEFLGHVVLNANNTPIPVGTTHIVVLSGSDYTNETGILGFKETTGSALQVTAISAGKFVRLYTAIVPGVSQLLTGTVGTVATSITQVSFFRYSL